MAFLSRELRLVKCSVNFMFTCQTTILVIVSILYFLPAICTLACILSLHSKEGLITLAASTLANQTYALVAANDVLLDSSVMKYSPTDCQRPEVLNKKLIEGNILLCGYSFNFVVGTASIKKVSETAKALGAVGFVLCVESVQPGTKFDPVPVGIPGILITDVKNSMVIDSSILESLCHYHY